MDRITKLYGWGAERSSSIIYIILLMAFVTPMDVSLISPTLPTLRDTFAVDAVSVSLVITVFALPGIITAPILGMLADSYGRRIVIVPCLVMFGISGGLIAFANEFWMVLVLRFIQGITGGSILLSLAMILVGDQFTGARRSRIMGYTTAGLMFGAAVYPFIGGLLTTYSWRLPFLVYLVSVAVGAAAYLHLDDPDDAARPSLTIERFRAVLDSIPVRKGSTLFGVTFLSFTLEFGGILTAVSLLLSESYGFTAASIGALISVSLLIAAIVSTLNGRFARHVRNQSLIGAAILIYGIGFLFIGLADSFVVFTGGMAVFAIGHGLAIPTTSMELTSLGTVRERGTVLSLRTSVVLSSQAIGPLAFTLPMVYFGIEPVLQAVGVLLLTTGCLVFVAQVFRREVATPF